ncbi:hypothetical protein KPH14_012247 [Odynerus spinipes]|uniref:Phospholipase A-2-activating protein n=1 Tax=Odynerus spinipes TaxID=1348599 RepID=A0AAD9RDM0_9HYME|nr:hypothetical protein KPH14_012247 [Odynerus spinipes]
MAKPSYKLSTVLFGHTLDVRAIATFTDGSIVSTSRDKTARVWKPSGNGKDYIETAVLKGHTNFVSSVCVINPSQENPKGLIITGSNDNTICVYKPDQREPFHVIEAHQNTVSNLRTGKTGDTFLSSSWDMTAKLWSIKDLTKPLVTLMGHTAAVWCVADLGDGNIITGSADKLIIVWAKDGSIRFKLSGHSDCVRGVVPIKDNEFLSCSNDATVRHWNSTSGTCLGSYCGHENYIYSITAMSNGTRVFTSGEDRTIRIWLNGEIDQIINLPTQSVWCIDLLPNGDIVTGSSDGVVRIFSNTPERFADLEKLQQFEEEVAITTINKEQELGGIQIKDLPDAKALQQPGQKEGQTKMISDGTTVKAYSWSQNEQRWMLIGNVVGASGGSTVTSGKQLYNGIEYDYVFSVDIQDGVPPLKLPYNSGQDPWVIAQKFLHDNDLSQLFLDQVANFIIKNSQPTPVLNDSIQYADPFTGGSRYIPGSNMINTPSESSSRSDQSYPNTFVSPSYIPHTKYLKLEQANLPAIIDKLNELNTKQECTFKITKERLELIKQLIENKIHGEYLADAINVLMKILNWPENLVFPALDIARLVVLHEDINEQIATPDLLQIINKHLKPNALPSNQMLTFRLIANLFHHEKGENFCLFCKDDILKTLCSLHSLGNKHNQIAISTYMLNLIVALNKCNDISGKIKTLHTMFTLLPLLNEPEAVFRALVGLGTLLSGTTNPGERFELIKAVQQSEKTLSILKTISENEHDVNIQEKVTNCSRQIIDLIT